MKNNFNEIKKKILTDDKIANAIEYMMSKVILDKKLPQLKFIYKKHKIVLGKNGLYSVYSPNKLKIANKIHFQEVAKYIVDNIKYPAKGDYIRHVEHEMFRHKEKIEFFTNYYNQKKSEILEDKISSMWDFYYMYKNSLINLLKENNLYL